MVYCLMMSAIQDKNNSLDSFNLLPAKKRLDFIINHETPLKFVRELPTQDLLLVIREVGAESSLELVEMMHPQQIKELFDLEVWLNDHINPKALTHYLAVMFEANRDRAITQIYNLDIELIGVLFKMTSTIHDLGTHGEPSEYPELFFQSPDGRFLVCFSDDDSLRDLSRMLHSFLDEICARDMKFALRLLENISFELVSLLEEASLRWRQNRLLDMGILPREERLSYFSPLTIADIKRLAQPITEHAFCNETTLLPMALIKTEPHKDCPFLTRALFEASDETKERFWQALVFATSNMHASLSGDFGDRESMIQTSNYIKFLIEAGLFQITNGKPELAGYALKHHSAQLLIRLGRTLVVTLRKRLTTNTDEAFLVGHDFCHVDSPLRECAKALMLAEPRYYDGLASSKELTVRYFASLHDVNITMAAITELLFRARFCGKDGLGFTAYACKKLSHLSHANMLARALINAYLKKDHPLGEVVVTDLHQIFGGADLNAQFIDFAHNMVTAIAKRLKRDDHDDEQALHDKAHNFKNAVLIQLTQNKALIVG
jgi:hypothetical protein